MASAAPSAWPMATLGRIAKGLSAVEKTEIMIAVPSMTIGPPAQPVAAQTAPMTSMASAARTPASRAAVQSRWRRRARDAGRGLDSLVPAGERGAEVGERPAQLGLGPRAARARAARRSGRRGGRVVEDGDGRDRLGPGGIGPGLGGAARSQRRTATWAITVSRRLRASRRAV